MLHRRPGPDYRLSPRRPTYLTSILAPRKPHLLQRILAPIAASVTAAPKTFASNPIEAADDARKRAGDKRRSARSWQVSERPRGSPQERNKERPMPARSLPS
jgi:hypothetical protein